MGGLLADLTLGSGAILAQQSGVAVTGRNTANINTPGYERESIDLSSLPNSPLVGGVVAGDASRASDDLLSAQERTQAGASGSAQALSTALSNLESALTPQSGDLAQNVGSLFGSIGALEASPADSGLRGQVITSAQALATTFHQAASDIAGAQSDADSQITSLVTTANSLSAQIASDNHALSTSNDPTLADQRDQAAQQLAALVGGQARIDPDGKMRFVLAGGAVLVDGDTSTNLTAKPSAALGNHVAVTVGSGAFASDVTKQIDGGQIGGLISFRDGAAQQAADSVDQLAYDLSTQMNAVHQANAGLDGVTGRNFFSPPAAVSGAASSLAVDPGIVANPNTLATAAPGAGTGDDSGVAALLALRDQPLAGGGTQSFTNQALNVVGAVGSAAATASANVTLQTTRGDALASTRDSVSGVSQEDEMAKLSQFQNAAEAASKFVAAVNDLLTTLMTNL